MNFPCDLARLADYQFKKIRSNCQYDCIVDYRIKENYIIFYARFVCKKRIIVKSVKFHKNGYFVD